MELDELRQNWQQPAPAEAPVGLDAAALTKLLARTSSNPVSKMRRNAWLEIAFVALTLIGCLWAAAATRDGYYLSTAAWLALVCLLSSFYFRRKLAVLRGLDNASGGAVREHVMQQLRSLRGLVRLYYQATMWSLPISLGIGLVFIASRIIIKSSGQKMLVGLAILVVAYAVIGVLTYFAMRSFTRWYIQRLYGQHLDRLEANLRELDDEPVA